MYNKKEIKAGELIKKGEHCKVKNVWEGVIVNDIIVELEIGENLIITSIKDIEVL